MTTRATLNSGTAPPTRFAITLAGVFLASMIATLGLWASLEPDCSRTNIAAFEVHCADATTAP